MEYIDTLENIHGETVEIYETGDGRGVVIFVETKTQHNAANVSAAIEKLYKMGFRF
jgi:hypothetical protein